MRQNYLPTEVKHSKMILIYEVELRMLPLHRRCILSEHISKCFCRPFPVSRLGEFQKAALYQEKGEIVALAVVREIDTEGETLKTPTVECLGVLPEKRRKGVGTELLRFITSDMGYPKLMLHIDRPGNSFYHLAQNLYISAGFVLVREDDLECEMVWEKEEKKV